MSKVKIFLPSVLANIAKGEKIIEVSASILEEAINELVKTYGDSFRDKIFDSTGKPRRLLNFYVNGKNVIFAKGLATQLADGDKVSILPAISGG